MHFEIRPGYRRPVERFEAHEEVRFRDRWMAVYRTRDAGAWQIYDNGERYGTREPSELRQTTTRHVLNVCCDCSKEFFAPRIEPACFACLIVQRPTEYEPAYEDDWPWRYSRREKQERLGVSKDRDE